MSEPLPPRRTACDRCRSHKLRCVRDAEDAESNTCRRCFRAKVQCSTNASARIGRLSSTSQGGRERQYKRSQVAYPSSPASNSTDTAERQVPTPASSTVLHVQKSPESGTSGGTRYSGLLLNNVLSQLDADTGAAAHEGTSILSHDLSNNNLLGLETAGISTHDVMSAPLDTREECITKLAELHSCLIQDLNIARDCQTADKCLAIIAMPEFSENYNFLIGRMLSNSTKLVEVLQYFVGDQSKSTQQQQEQQRLNCDKPTLFSLFSCCTYLVRIYRLILTCIHESIVKPPAAPDKLPPVFPGLHLGGYSLEPHMDIQVSILVSTCERMLVKIDELMGLKSCQTLGLLQLVEDSGNILHLMLKDERDEQHIEGILVGNQKSLSDILNSLKAAV